MKYMQINVSYKYKCAVSEREMTMSIGIIANPELIGHDDIARKVKSYIKDKLLRSSGVMVFVGITELNLRVVLCASQPVFDIG